MRAVAALIGLASFATLLAEGLAVGVLAARGQLSTEAISTIGAALAGRPPQTAAAEVAQPLPPPPSAEQIETARTLKTLDLNARADELGLLKDMLAAEAEQLKAERKTFDQTRKSFEDRLADLGARNIDEAVEQTRSVVKAMPAREAVTYLVSLPEPDVVRIMKGLPERTLAKILQEFAAGTDEEQQRGRKIFAAIADGTPEAAAVESASEALNGSTTDGASP